MKNRPAKHNISLLRRYFAAYLKTETPESDAKWTASGKIYSSLRTSHAARSRKPLLTNSSRELLWLYTLVVPMENIKPNAQLETPISIGMSRSMLPETNALSSQKRLNITSSTWHWIIHIIAKALNQSSSLCRPVFIASFENIL